MALSIKSIRLTVRHQCINLLPWPLSIKYGFFLKWKNGHSLGRLPLKLRALCDSVFVLINLQYKLDQGCPEKVCSRRKLSPSVVRNMDKRSERLAPPATWFNLIHFDLWQKWRGTWTQHLCLIWTKKLA